MVRGRLRELMAGIEGTIFTIGFAGPESLADSAGGHFPPTIDLDRAELPLAASKRDAVALVARSVADLRRAATMRALLPSSKRLFVGVTEMGVSHRPKTVHLPDAAEWDALRSLHVQRGPGTGWFVEAATDRAAPLGELIAAVVATAAEPTAPVAPLVGLADPGATQWSPGAHAVVVPPGTGDGTSPFPASDLLVRTETATAAPEREGAVAVIDRPGPDGPLEELTADELPPVDELAVNPIGFTNDAEAGTAVLRYDGANWTAAAPDAAMVRLPSDGAVTDADITRLRPFASVAIDWNSHPGSVAAVRAVAGLAAAGVPLTCRNPSPDWAGALGTELRDRIDGADPETFDDTVQRQLHSIAVRRIALRDHSRYARWSALRAANGLPAATPAVTALLCTRRPEFLEFAIGQIDGQRHRNLEIVLVLHGLSADLPEVKRAIGRTDLPVAVVEVAGSTVFGDALNAGVRAAGGDFIAKFDDDDWYGPHHLDDLLSASRYSGADLVGNLAELVHLEPLRTTVYRFGVNERRSRHVSGGTMLIRRGTIADLGGFRPLPSAIDVALLQSLLAARGRIYRMHGLGYVLSRRAEGHTWAQPPGEFLAQAKRQWPGVNLGEAVSTDAPFPS
ncbi:glycosyltransferase [Glycomyces luteolus]|uniref:Glycosyltransferase n=1 Tax=Glycomyces luteolus TaxID=2670330 RepID=A0A9X3PBZ0_9ACTN|nr:glycosyltransferase [Glycomyces luteolus]MDA1362541.1 glycosyltransferase [Glycomyces luteolus]